MKLIKKGAEANLYLDSSKGPLVLVKSRIKKSYRHSHLDIKIRETRTKYESRIMIKARKNGLPIPKIIDVDIKNTTIYMEFLEGEQLKNILDTLPIEERKNILINVGKSIGNLHNLGIIHGDLTTSNMIWYNNKVYLIDFGLSYHSSTIEDFGVDLHLLERAFDSTHYKMSAQYFNWVKQGYSKVQPKSELVFKKVDEIVKRGRYRRKKE